MNMHARSEDIHLDIKGITCRFGSTTAVDNVFFSARRGEIICLVGHSGCGKSSLLRLIAGIERPLQGAIHLDGRMISGPQSHIEPEQRGIGLMFQDYALFPHLTVRANVMFGLKSLPKPEARKRSNDLLDRLGLHALADRFPHMLSGGEQQRVALARALAPRPAVLLMDEPFSNLDRGLRDEVRGQTINLLRELGTTAILVTHDPEEALSAGDRVILMRDGAIVQCGTGSEIYDCPVSAYVAEFFCSFNKVRGACHDGFLNTPIGRFEAPSRLNGDQATVFIRPQSLRFCRDGDGVECTVIDCALRGEIEEVRLSVDALSEPLRIRSTERSSLRSGDATRIAVGKDGVFVF